MSEAEDAVRNYLVFLEDPSKLIDHDEVARLEAVAAAAADPLDKLHAINHLHQVRAGEPDAYRQAFIQHAKQWADAHGIRPTSFLEMGVDEATLRAARIPVSGERPPRAGRRPRPGVRRQVRLDDVKSAARAQRGEFTLADLASASGASPMTIRKAVDELIAAGEVERLGPAPNWTQPGRAPILFRSASKRSRR